MRPNANNRRSRGRGGRKSGNPRNQTYDSNGPGARVRGNPSQIYEKYQQLARDAASSGDRVGAENFLQHAEHYFRLMNAAAAKNEQRNNAEEGGRDENSRDDAPRKSGNGHGAFVEDLQADDGDDSDGDGADDETRAKSDDGEAKPSGRKRRTRRANGRDGAKDASADDNAGKEDDAGDAAGEEEGASA